MLEDHSSVWMILERVCYSDLSVVDLEGEVKLEAESSPTLPAYLVDTGIPPAWSVRGDMSHPPKLSEN